jgi:hypothetical protein
MSQRLFAWIPREDLQLLLNPPLSAHTIRTRRPSLGSNSFRALVHQKNIRVMRLSCHQIEQSKYIMQRHGQNVNSLGGSVFCHLHKPNDVWSAPWISIASVCPHRSIWLQSAGPCPWLLHDFILHQSKTHSVHPVFLHHHWPYKKSSY